MSQLEKEFYAKAVEFGKEHSWYRNKDERKELHKAVEKLLRFGEKPEDMDRLVMEFPHVSTSDGARVGYTRSVEHGEAERFTVVNLGKYLKRHFTQTADHNIRDLVAEHTPGEVRFTTCENTIRDIFVYGPQTCMSNTYDFDRHPSAIYDPKYGWKMAYMVKDGEYCSRAMVLDNGMGKCFVKTYKGAPWRSDSQPCEVLKAKLQAMGYRQVSGYPEGTKLAKIEVDRDAYLMAFIDGENDVAHIDDGLDREYFVLRTEEYKPGEISFVADASVIDGGYVNLGDWE